MGNDTMVDAWPNRIRFVDVGAMGGLQPKWRPHIASLMPILFEPNPKQAARLRLSYPDSIVVESALSNTIGKMPLIITENPTCISLRYPNQDFLASYGIRKHFQVIDIQEVECTRYDHLYQKEIVPQPDIIKLDVQGCEYEALLGFGHLLQNCIGIEIEAQFAPLYQGQRLIQDIIILLSSFGFVLRKIDQNKMDNFDGDLVEVDAYFTKPRSVVRRYDQKSRKYFDLLTAVWDLDCYA